MRTAVLLILIPLALPAASVEHDPIELSRHLDELYRSQSSHGILEMIVTTPHFERALKMEEWSQGMDLTLLRILSPRKEEGITTLRRGNEMWNYLPKIGKTMRVPPSMMMSSWMGSDFTNDDLVKETSWEEDYDVALADGGPGRIALAFTPRPEVPVTWSRIVVILEEDSLLPVSQEYYDEKGRLARLLEFSEPRSFSGRRLPARLTLTPLLKEGYRTEIVYLELEFDIDLPADLFTQSSLRR